MLVLRFAPGSLAVLLLVGGVAGQVWTQRVLQVAPAASESPGMAFDPTTGRVLLFGGSGRAETWLWDGLDWVAVSLAASPPAGVRHLVADTLRRRVVLFGGSGGGSLLQDTWEWDGTTWGPRITAHYPAARIGCGLVFDPSRGKVVMFGGQGFSASGTSTNLSDTWEYDGVDWLIRPVAPSPSRRSSPAMGFDMQTGQVVLYGGFDQNWQFDTWAWDGATWRRLSPAANPMADSPGIVEHSGIGRLILVGRGRSSASSMQVWSWGGNNWVLETNASGPSRRTGFGIAFDSTNGTAVLQGGRESTQGRILDDTWEFGGPVTVASATVYGTGCGIPQLGLVPRASARPLLGRSMFSEVSGAPLGGAFMSIGLSDTAVGAFQLPLPLASFGMTGCYWLQSSEVFMDATNPLGPGITEHTLAIPNLVAFSGASVFLQAWAIDPTQPGGHTVSNGLELHLGNR